MNFASVSQDAATNSRVAIIDASAVSSAATMAIPSLMQTNMELTVEAPTEISNNGYSENGYAELMRWNTAKNERFNQLALKESAEELSIEEWAELNSLSKLRRLAKFPRPSHEILWERKQRKYTNNLVRALTEYVEFHETARDA